MLYAFLYYHLKNKLERDSYLSVVRKAKDKAFLAPLVSPRLLNDELGVSDILSSKHKRVDYTEIP